MKFTVLIYTFVFENSLGPVFWLYTAEFLIPLSFSIVAFVNWATIVIISIASPYMITWSAPNTFYIYAAFCLIGGIYSTIFLRETRGLSKEEISKLYSSEEVEEETEMMAGTKIQ